jgi:hypothetical protein
MWSILHLYLLSLPPNLIHSSAVQRRRRSTAAGHAGQLILDGRRWPGTVAASVGGGPPPPRGQRGAAPPVAALRGAARRARGSGASPLSSAAPEAERRAPCRPPAPKLDAWTPHQPQPAPVAPLLRVEQLASRRAPARPAPTLSVDSRTLDTINHRLLPPRRRRPEGCQHPQATTPWN